MIWNEAGNGDFSGNGLAPTLLLLGAAVLMCSASPGSSLCDGVA